MPRQLIAVLFWTAIVPAAAQTRIPAAITDAYSSGQNLPRIPPAGLSDEAKGAYGLALDVQDGCRADEDADAYRARAAVAAEKLGLTGDAASAVSRTYAACRPRDPSADNRPLDPAVEAEVVKRELAAKDLAADRRAALTSRATLLAEQLGRMNDSSDVSAGTVNPTVDRTPAPDAAAVAARLNAAAPPTRGLHTTAVPEPSRLHALASDDVAPAAGLVDRAMSLTTRSGPLVAQDLAVIRSKIAATDAPTVQALNDGHPEAVSEFYAWMKTAKDSDLPAISYGILDKGEIGRYNRSAFGKGTITINYFIRDAEPTARAAVEFHELYHYWDNEVARSYYPNVSYGHIDPAHLHEHEYDAYMVTALFWGQAKPENAKSPLAKYLDALPSDRDAVRAMVDKAAGGHE